MLSSVKLNGRRIRRYFWVLIASAALPGIIGSCNDRLVGLSRFVDPCGTIFANCFPGDFEVRAADIGDFCVDPECTIPGGCDTGRQPLGTIMDVCP